MKIGVSLPVRELEDDLAAIRDFATLAEELGFAHLSARPYHPAQKAAVLEDFKKTSRAPSPRL